MTGQRDQVTVNEPPGTAGKRRPWYHRRRLDPEEQPVSTPVPTLALRSGVRIPQIGLGTWPMDDATAERVVPTAVEAGYRLVDTAENYENERGVGRGLRAAGLPRE